MKCSHFIVIFPNSSEISPKIQTIFLKSMKCFRFLQENLPIFFTVQFRKLSELAYKFTLK